jgi:hypothetical protein
MRLSPEQQMSLRGEHFASSMVEGIKNIENAGKNMSVFSGADNSTSAQETAEQNAALNGGVVLNCDVVAILFASAGGDPSKLYYHLMNIIKGCVKSDKSVHVVISADADAFQKFMEKNPFSSGD